MVVVVDYGAGNLGSILNMLKKIGVDACISSNDLDIKRAEKIILPGVGAFDNAMENLVKLGLVDVLNDKVIRQKTPILGICLGMQLFSKKSSEGDLPGLGWIEAETVKFGFGDKKDFKIPHMGWNRINMIQENPLFQGMFPEARFYFVHSYHLMCANQSDILATTLHGYNFVSAIARDNIAGVQFHPEKSHKFGIKLLENFAKLF